MEIGGSPFFIQNNNYIYNAKQEQLSFYRAASSFIESPACLLQAYIYRHAEQDGKNHLQDI